MTPDDLDHYVTYGVEVGLTIAAPAVEGQLIGVAHTLNGAPVLVIQRDDDGELVTIDLEMVESVHPLPPLTEDKLRSIYAKKQQRKTWPTYEGPQ